MDTQHTGLFCHCPIESSRCCNASLFTVEQEEDIMKLEKEAFFLRKRLDEINDARATTTHLESKILPSESEVLRTDPFTLQCLFFFIYI